MLSTSCLLGRQNQVEFPMGQSWVWYRLKSFANDLEDGIENEFSRFCE